MSRRPLPCLLGLLLVPTLFVTACGDDDASDSGSGSAAESAPPEATGEWSFTDDRGIDVTLPEQPERIVAYHNAAAALIPLRVHPVGVFGGSAPEDSSLLAGLDLDGIDSVGEVYGELNFEALAAADPDLIVTLFDPAQEGPSFGFLGGCWAPTRARSTKPTCRATSTSSSSASTAAPPAAAARSSTACSSSPSATNPSAIATSSSTPSPRRGRPLEVAGATHRASAARQRTAHGEPPDQGWSGQVDTPNGHYPSGQAYDRP